VWGGVLPDALTVRGFGPALVATKFDYPYVFFLEGSDEYK
jgi:hypothetical protein